MTETPAPCKCIERELAIRVETGIARTMPELITADDAFAGLQHDKDCPMNSPKSSCICPSVEVLDTNCPIHAPFLQQKQVNFNPRGDRRAPVFQEPVLHNMPPGSWVIYDSCNCGGYRAMRLYESIIDAVKSMESYEQCAWWPYGMNIDVAIQKWREK